MAPPRALVLRAAGTNCDAETAYAFELCGARTEILPLQPFLEQPARLREFDLLAIPGGFSYGDDVLAGRVFGLELAERAGAEVLGLIERGGAAIGICNGFQVLVQMGLLPGLEEPLGKVEVTLTDNEHLGYRDCWVRLVAAADHCVFLSPGESLYLPVAHAEGNLKPRDEAVREALRREGRVALRYVAADGSADPSFPDNPNGSTDHIAGLTDKSGRILGLMPHPERHLFPFQHPTWTRDGLADEPDGLKIFKNAVAAVS